MGGRLQFREAVKALWVVPAEAPSLWLVAGAAAGTAPPRQLLGVVSVLAASRTWSLQQGTQGQPFISRKLTKGPSFRRVQVQGTPNTHQRMFQALQPPQTGTQEESTLEVVSKPPGASAQALPV